ncbi:MAG: ImmA/IrrE family metallo-endopeptidase [Sulfurimonas sp.]|nr:ImmA/IrrE family metallo-endopeptidase [Sulfurimonas sp.]
MIKKTFDLNSWEDFTVNNKTSDTKSYYNNYLSFLETVKKLPTNELIKKGWITDKNDLTSLVPLFQNMIDGNFQVLFRKSRTSNEALYALWLSRVSNVAKERILKQEISKFKGLTKENLKDIAKLSPDESLILELPSILAKHGIVLVYEQGIKSMKLDGAVFKLFTGHPVIGLSFRYSRIDNFWFTLMHELSHIVLHYEQLDTPIFDDLDEESPDLIEKQANRLAKSSFVEKAVWRSCKANYQTGDDVVCEFAKEVGIHPAIIAGLLQYEKKSYKIYSKIVNKTNLRNKVFLNE